MSQTPATGIDYAELAELIRRLAVTSEKWRSGEDSNPRPLDS